jgi:hypothetical protein
MVMRSHFKVVEVRIRDRVCHESDSLCAKTFSGTFSFSVGKMGVEEIQKI